MTGKEKRKAEKRRDGTGRNNRARIRTENLTEQKRRTSSSDALLCFFLRRFCYSLNSGVER